MSVPLFGLFVVTVHIFAPLYLSLQEVESSSSSSPGPGGALLNDEDPGPEPDNEPDTGSDRAGRMPLRGDSHGVDPEALSVQPTIPHSGDAEPERAERKPA
jgi:hypothetical protein